ncbi:MAG: type II toxin-antitoxin system HigB family toxin [Tepidisphaeraceae bacterium]
MRRLKDFWTIRAYSDSEAALRHWIEIVMRSSWGSPTDAKATFGKRVDFVATHGSGSTVAVFDIAGNKYRLITAIHHLPAHADKGRVYILRILTHRQYDQQRWKEEL